MKYFTLLLHVLISISLCAQDDIETKFENDTLYTKSGFKIYDNQMLKIGNGSMPDGDFKYIRIAATSMFQYTGTDRSRVNSANSLPASNRGFSYKVVRIQKYGTKKNGYTYYPIINVGAIRFQIDIDNAIAFGELDVPDEFKPKEKTATIEIKQPISVADELAKLKKLYDDGVLTKEEYEQQKKKLLEQ